jgi:hypothetical protein
MRRKLTLTSICALIAMLPLSAFACDGDHGCSAGTTMVMLPVSWWIISIGVALVVLALLIGMIRRRVS